MALYGIRVKKGLRQSRCFSGSYTQSGENSYKIVPTDCGSQQPGKKLHGLMQQAISARDSAQNLTALYLAVCPGTSNRALLVRFAAQASATRKVKSSTCMMNVPNPVGPGDQ